MVTADSSNTIYWYRTELRSQYTTDHIDSIDRIGRNQLRAVSLLNPEGMNDSRGKEEMLRILQGKREFYGSEDFQTLRPCRNSKVKLEAR